jgi:ribosome biogenesis GTPase
VTGPPGSARHPLADRLAPYGWDDHWAAEFALLPGAPARVTRVDRGAVRAVTATGPVSATPAIDSTLVTGDWIAVDHDGADDTTVAASAPRRTALVRRAPGAEPAPQTLAANMDEVWVMHGAERPLRAAWLDRALVVAYGSGATPLIVITKTDLVADPARAVAAARALSPGTGVVTTSTVTGEGMDTLARRLDGGRCAVLLGRSGSGKSSLVNTLAGDAVQVTGSVRAGDARGRHTTTRRALVAVADGCVIDTPGVRALGLWDAGPGLQGAFPDIAEHALTCRFSDCRHEHEPGCEVMRARDDGDLPLDRYQRYITLSSEWLDES